MALTPLATAADLADRSIIDISDVPQETIDALLKSASEAIRSAAGVAISQHTSTVRLPLGEGAWLALPGPVVSVESVTVNGVQMAGWSLVGDDLWRPGGWRNPRPVLAEVTYTHGYAEVPADIVDLTCRLVASALDEVRHGTYGSRGAVESRTRAIDDYRETDTYDLGSAGGAGGVMELPAATRQWLRQRFGGGVYVTGAR